MEETKIRKTLKDEEENKKRVQAVTEEPLLAGQEEGRGGKGNRKGRRGPVFWGCGEPGHVLKECELWKEFHRSRQPAIEAREGEKSRS